MVKSKLVGFIEMKKQEGKVLFIEKYGVNGVVGVSAEKEFIYGDLAKKVTEAAINKEIILQFDRGYSGKAFVSDLVIK